MAFDEDVANRVREAFARLDVMSTEQQMFGGLAFMVRGHMTVGVIGDELMVRVGPDAYDGALAEPDARPMDFTGREMKGFVFVAAEGFEDDGALGEWVQRGLDFTSSLPAK